MNMAIMVTIDVLKCAADGATIMTNSTSSLRAKQL